MNEDVFWKLSQGILGKKFEKKPLVDFLKETIEILGVILYETLVGV